MALRDLLTFSGMFARTAPPIVDVDVRAIPMQQAWTFERKAAGDIDQVVTGSGAGELEAWWRRNEEVIADSFRKVGVVYSCIRLIANSFAESPIGVYQHTGEQPKRVDNHPARLLFEQPNPEQSEAEFSKSIIWLAAVNDYAIVELVRNGLGEVIEMRPRNPTRWNRRTRDNGTHYWEVRRKSGQLRTVEDEDVAVIPYDIDPELQRFGLSPVRVIAREAGSEDALTSFLQRFLMRGGIIPYVLTQEGPIWDSSQIRRMQIEMASYHSGGAIERAPILSGGVKLVQTGQGLNDMAWPDLRGINELKIAQVWGVLPQLIGSYESVIHTGLSPADLDEAQTYHQRYTINPLRTQIAGALQRKVLRAMEEDRKLYLAYDLTRVLALQEERDKAHARARADYQANLMTFNEGREAIGLEGIGDAGDVLPIRTSIIYVDPEELIEASKPAPVPAALQGATISEVVDADDEAEDEERRISPRWASRKDDANPLRVKAVTETRRSIDKLTDPAATLLRQFFVDQGKRIIPQVTEGASSDRSKGVDDVDWQEETRLLKQVLDVVFNAAVDDALVDVNQLLDTTIAWDVTNPDVVHIEQTLAARVVNISATTRTDIARVVAQALDEGISLAELEQRLFGLFDETYSRRSMTIARTESMLAYNRASLYGYMQSGQVQQVELWDNPDHTEAYGASDGLTCAQRDGLIVELGNTEQHIYAEHPNGSLAVAPIVT
jgi:HK97 family phage portal protein